MTIKKIRVAIIGMGVVGSRRKFFLSKNKKYLIKYISDKRFKKDFTKNNINYFKHYKKISCKDIDAVFVTLPNYLAPKVTIYFLERNIHVFCEKPPGRNVQDVKDVLRVIKKKKKTEIKIWF